MRPLVWLGVMLAVSGFPSQVMAQDATERYFDGLLDRGLVRIAQTEALRRLRDDLLKPVDRATWSLRLVQAYRRQSELSGPEDREAYLDRADRLLEELAAVQPPLPRQEAMAVERIALEQTRANLLLGSSLSAAPSDRTRQAAIAALRKVIEQYRELIPQLGEAARRAARRTPAQLSDGEFSGGDIRRLARDVEQQLAQTQVSLVEALPSGTERDATAHTADERLKTLADGWIGEARTWDARLLRAKLARLQGNSDQAAVIVRSALRDDPADWLVDRFMAELVRSQLAAGQIDVALQTLLTYTQQRQTLPEELGALQVEALLAGWRLAEQAKDSASAGEFWAQANRFAERLEGGWRSRAMLLIDQARETSRYGEEVAALVQTARTAYAAGETERALTEFEQAADRAIALKVPEAADEFDFTRASILIDLSRFADAAEVLERLLTRSPNAKSGEDAGLLLAYSLGRLYEAEATRTRREAYVATLERHRERYHDRPSFVEATWMLATLEENRQQWTNALELYREIANDPERGPASQVRIAMLYQRILERLREIKQPPDTWEDRAIEDLAGYVQSYPQKADELTLPQAEVIVRLVHIALGHREQAYAAVDRRIEPVLLAAQSQRRAAERDGRPLDEGWDRLSRVAAQLRVVSLAGQGRIDEARRVFESLAAVEPRTLLGITLGLTDLAKQIPAQQRQALAHLQLDAGRRINEQRSSLNAAEQRALDLSLAEAYVAAGNVYDAALIYEALLKAQPDDRRLLRTVAELLSQHEGQEATRKSLELWRRIERMEKRGTPLWLESRWQMAELTARLGQHEEAGRLITFTRLVAPEMGGEELRKKFEELERRLANGHGTSGVRKP